ncbi:MAG: ATP-binding protein [Planctomycetota bacterium]
MKRSRKHTRYVWYAALLAAIVLVGSVVGGKMVLLQLRKDNAVEGLRHKAIDLAADLDAEVFQGVRQAQTALVHSRQVLELLRSPAPAGVEQVVREAEVARRMIGASIIYLMNLEGRVVASTTFRHRKTGEERSLLGETYAFRPYFIKALAGHPICYPALGVTTGERGLYYGAPVAGQDRRVLGVLVIKMGVNGLDQSLQQGGERSFLFTPGGVVFAASNPEWLYRTRSPLSETERKRIEGTKQFAGRSLLPLGTLLDGSDRIHSMALRVSGWSLGLVGSQEAEAPLTSAQRNLFIAGGVGVGALVVVLALFILNTLMAQRAAERLARSEAHFQAIFDSAFQYTAILDAEGGILRLNLPLLQFSGRGMNDFLGCPLWEAPWLRTTVAVQERLRRAITEGGGGRSSRLEVEFADPHGRTITVDFSIKPMGGEAGCDLLLAEGRDISEAKRVHDELMESRATLERRVEERTEELRHSEEVYRDLYETCPIGLWQMDAEGKHLLKANSAMLNLLGASSLSAASDRFDREQLFPAGRFDSFLRELAQNGRVDEFDTVFTTAKGEERRGWVAAMLKQEEAVIEGSLIDVSARRAAEEALQEANEEVSEAMTALKNTQGQLVESEKMSSLGGLVAGVAHEINTPVGIGVTAASHLKEKSEAIREALVDGSMTKSQLQRYLDRVCEGTEMILSNLTRAAELVQSFKQVAVDQSSELPRRFDLKQYLEEVLTSLHPRYKRSGHSVSLEAEEGITLDCAPGPLAQVITNLLTNSLLHGFVGVEAGRIQILALRERDGIVIRYRDNGCGMSDEVREKIFEPFFTTRRGEGGSGLGMHLVYNLVTQKLGGTIACRSTPGAGSEFEIVLPLSMVETVEMKAVSESGHVLLVDDEDTIRSVTEELLLAMGYRVTIAGSGEEAIERYRQDADTLDVVLLDMVMPGMGGERVMKAMREISTRPGIILSSGYGLNQVDAQRYLDEGASSFIKKPYRLSILEKELGKVMAGRGQSRRGGKGANRI